MKIAFITHRYFPERGGVEETIRGLSREFRRLGHRVIVLAGRRDRSQPLRTAFEGTSVIRFPMVRDFVPLSRFGTHAREQASVRHTVSFLHRALHDFQPDIINVQYDGTPLLFTLLAASDLPAPVIATLQGYAQQCYHRNGAYSRLLFRALLRGCDYVIGNSDSMLRDARRIVPSITRRSCVIPNGVDLREFRSRRPHPHPRPYILALGRMDPLKGFDLLLLAFAELLRHRQDTDLLLAGEGWLKPGLQELSRKLGLERHVRFLGEADRKKVVQLLNGCRFLVVPSTVEPFGIVNLEGMAAGKAVVAFSVGGIPEVVQTGRTGILVPCPDITRLTQAMLRLLEDPERAKRYGTHGRLRSERFDWPIVARRYLTLFSRLRNGTGNAS